MIHTQTFSSFCVLLMLLPGCIEAAFEEELMDLFSEAPSIPKNLTALPGNREVVLTWAPSPLAAGHEVLRSSTSGAGYESIASLETLNSGSYTDQGVQNGQRYFYVVIAYNIMGRSGFSNEAEATPMEPPGSSASPFSTELSFTPSGVLVTWQQPGSATGYRVLRSDTPSGPYDQLGDALTGVSFLDISVQSHSTYHYVVSAFNEHGGEESSSIGTILTDEFTGPLAPSRFSGSVDGSEVLLTWRHAQGAASYALYRGTLPGTPPSFLTFLHGDASSHADATSPEGVVYYEISSLNDAGDEGPHSDSIMVER